MTASGRSLGTLPFDPMWKVFKAIFFTLLFIVGVTFATENTGLVVLRYYFGLETPPLPIFVLVLVSVLVGVFLAGVGFLMDQRSLRRALREKERELETLEKEIQSYREWGRTKTGIKESL